MLRTLLVHPDSVAPAVEAIEAEVERTLASRLQLRFRIHGAIDQLLMPPARAARRADGLWQHLCFELFVQREGGPGYFEFNLSPSSEWAAYRFDGYRTGMRDAQLSSPPRIEAEAGPAAYELRAELDLGGLADLPATEPWRAGLAAVIEEPGGGKSYWALAHPPGKPDFHHRHCFAVELAAAESE